MEARRDAFQAITYPIRRAIMGTLVKERINANIIF